MKTLKLTGIVCGVALLAGCNRPSNSTTSANEERNAPTVVQTDTNLNLITPPSPTGRDTNQTNRIYSTPTDKTPAVEPDNTRINSRDRSDTALTPEDQGGSESDREITRNIRKGIMARDELSTTAKNVKIITQDGKVTLRGPVNSETEQKTIEEIAKGVANVSGVDNQLEVKPASQPNQ